MPYDTAIPTLVDGPRVRAVFYGPDVPKIEEETFGGNVEQWAMGVITRLNQPRAKTTVTVGTPIDLTPPVVPALTPQQVYDHDRAIRLQDVQAIAAGIYDESDANAAAHLATVKASYAALKG